MEIFLMDVMKNIFNGCDEIFNDGMMEIFLMMIEIFLMDVMKNIFNEWYDKKFLIMV